MIPRSLAGRTIVILLIGFAAIQLIGLGIHTRNEINLAHIEEDREFATRAVIIYRHIAAAAPQDRLALVAKEAVPPGDKVFLSPTPPPLDDTYELPVAPRQFIRAAIIAYGIPAAIRPHGLEVRGALDPVPTNIISFGLPDPDQFGPFTLPPGIQLPPGFPQPPGPQAPARMWLTFTSPIAAPAPWRSPGFATAFLVMTVLGAVMIFWAVRQLLVPVKTLARAAERLGQDVINAPNLPERGPLEIVTAAIAFNTMAARIRSFVEDRTFLLTAISHDLRTPITRLKLRAEYMDDDEQRVKMLADLDEMEAMVAATLAFGRDITTSEPVAPIDLAVLLRTLLDEAADCDAGHADAIRYQGPEHLRILARPLGLKRALSNIIGNALKYGDAARVTMRDLPKNAGAQIDVEDDGPGIDPADMTRVFEPFRRLETSRNRETGGSGLGLSIAQTIMRAHGGDIVLENLDGGGLRVRITLPA